MQSAPVVPVPEAVHYPVLDQPKSGIDILKDQIANQTITNNDLKQQIDAIIAKQSVDDGKGSGSYKWEDTAGTAADLKSG